MAKLLDLSARGTFILDMPLLRGCSSHVQGIETSVQDPGNVDIITIPTKKKN
jgi:hypothetical protein